MAWRLQVVNNVTRWIDGMHSHAGRLASAGIDVTVLEQNGEVRLLRLPAPSTSTAGGRAVPNHDVAGWLPL